MKILPRNTPIDKTQADTSQTYRAIAVTNVERGEGDCVATLDLKLGGLLIHGFKVRRGRQGATNANLPSIRVDGAWVDGIEILSPSLEDFVRQKVFRAVAEVTR